MAHKDIRIPFEIDGQQFEAVGFLEDGEDWVVSRSEVISRVARDGYKTIDDSDIPFFYEENDRQNNVRQLPEELNDYMLLTNARATGWDSIAYSVLCLHIGFDETGFMDEWRKNLKVRPPDANNFIINKWIEAIAYDPYTERDAGYGEKTLVLLCRIA